MSKLQTKYYRFRRRRLMKIARKRKNAVPQVKRFFDPIAYLNSKERERYYKFGIKWYRSLNLNFGTDVTGLGLSKADLTDISDLPGEKAERERPSKLLPVVDRSVKVTFDTVYRDDGTVYEYPLYNGEIAHPIYGEMDHGRVRGWIERNGKPE